MKVVDAINLIWNEYKEAQQKFNPFNNAHEGYAVILEELDELWDLIKSKPTAQNLKDREKEVKQVGAMALRFLIDLC